MDQVKVRHLSVKYGRKINVINHVDNNAFFDYITALAKKVN